MTVPTLRTLLNSNLVNAAGHMATQSVVGHAALGVTAMRAAHSSAVAAVKVAVPPKGTFGSAVSVALTPAIRAVTAVTKPTELRPKFHFSAKQAVAPRQGIDEAQRNWLYFERYVNGIAPRPNNPHATYTEVEEEFQPANPNASFKLPVFALPRDMCTVRVSKAADPRIAAQYATASHVQFAVYPQVLRKGAEPHLDAITKHPQTAVDVAPTASSRSLFVLGDDPSVPAHIVKTHLPLRITRNMRGLNDPKIAHSLEISDRIAAAAPGFGNPQFAFLPETFGVAVKGSTSADSWGYLVRELTPRPFLPGVPSRPLLPLFALFSTDKRDATLPPVLCEMIKASGEDPKKFVLERILFPVIRVWAEVYQKTGIILESHGQNTLFELDERGMPARVVSRDFSAYLSKEMYEANGGSTATLNASKIFSKNGVGGNPPTECILSSVFDQSIRVPFDRIAELCQHYYKIPVAEIQKYCREYFKVVFPTADQHFPANGVVYNIKDTFSSASTSGGKTEFVPTGKPAEWRY